MSPDIWFLILLAVISVVAIWLDAKSAEEEESEG